MTDKTMKPTGFVLIPDAQRRISMPSELSSLFTDKIYLSTNINNNGYLVVVIRPAKTSMYDIECAVDNVRRKRFIMPYKIHEILGKPKVYFATAEVNAFDEVDVVLNPFIKVESINKNSNTETTY